MVPDPIFGLNCRRSLGRYQIPKLHPATAREPRRKQNEGLAAESHTKFECGATGGGAHRLFRQVQVRAGRTMDVRSLLSSRKLTIVRRVHEFLPPAG